MLYVNDVNKNIYYASYIYADNNIINYDLSHTDCLIKQKQQLQIIGL